MSCSRVNPRMFWKLSTMVVVAFLIALIATPAQADELVTFPAGSSVDLPPTDDETVTLFVPVAPVDDVELTSGASAELLQVRRGAELLTPEDGDLTVDLVTEPPGLSVVLMPTMLAASATYNLDIRVNVGTSSQFVSVSIVRPPSTVDIVQTAITVERTVLVPEWGLNWNPSWDGDLLQGVDKPELNMRVGAEGRIHELTITDITGENSHITVEPMCSVDGCDDLKDLAPDTLLDLEYQLVHDFSLGTESRTLEVRSEQLAAPVEFTILVETRRTPVLLGLLLVAGIVLGLLVRVLLARVGDAGEVRVQRDELIKRLRALDRHNPDTDLSDKLAAHADRLERLSAWKVKETKEEIAEVAQAAKKDLDDHAAAVTALKKRVDDLRALSVERPLSKVVAAKLERARGRYQLAVSLLSTNDVKKATPEVDELEADATAARSSVVDWLGDYKQGADRLADSIKDKRMPLQGTVDLSAFVPVEDAAKDGAEAATLANQPNAVAPGLGAVLDAAVNTSARHLDLEEAVKRLSGYLGRQSLNEEAADIQATLTDPDEVQVVKQLIVPVGAAADALATKKPPKVRPGLAPQGQPAAQPAPASQKRDTVTLAELPYAPDTWLDGLPLLGGAFVYGLASTAAKAIRFVILSLLVIVIGYATWQSDWTGTTTDMVGVLAAGFAAEISTDAVTTAATGFTKRS